MIKRVAVLICIFSLVAPVIAIAADNIATLRRGADLNKQPKAPPIPKLQKEDTKQVRNYPEQPPVIPHKIEGYQVDKNINRCMTCHSRKRTGKSQAVAISITHYMDRDGNFLASISPRRYFCNQCHVSQYNVKTDVGNSFVDIDTIIKRARKKKGKK